MVDKFIKVLCFLTFSISVFAQEQEQQIARYYFEGNFNSLTSDFPPLEMDGEKGEFVQEVVEKYGRNARTVYQLPSSAGLKFDNSKLENFISGSYTIEMFFRYTDGQLLLYNQLLGDQLERNQGKYVHLVVTRNHETKQIFVYLNGQKTLEFVDANNDLEMAKDREIFFFTQDGVKTTSGAVAMIKIYNYFVDLELSQELFASYGSSSISAIVKDEKTGKIKLDNLYFVQAETSLLAESLPTIDAVVDFLVENPKVRIEIQGHTDNQGDYYKNVELSKARAEEIRKYLITSGIDENRLEARGFGGSRPIESNYAEDTRKLNRRVELEVLK
ncbi:OmpA family protein [Spirosomataceae bacterium TFI 002]|nr:OmpA family protein [Spirosomataceae bacterium TFI 002]